MEILNPSHTSLNTSPLPLDAASNGRAGVYEVLGKVGGVGDLFVEFEVFEQFLEFFL